MVQFLNWFFFFFIIIVGSLAAVTILVYIQDNLGRAWGYGICVCAILVGLAVFQTGTRRYRFKKLVRSPQTQIASVCVAEEAPGAAVGFSLLFDVGDAVDEEGRSVEDEEEITRS